MPKIDNKTKKMLLVIASKLPVTLIVTHEKHYMTKEELEEYGYVGAEKLEDGRYLYKYPVQYAQNHYRQLRKAYQKDGFDGCSAYIDKIKSLKNA